MKKVLIMAENGFEEIETFTPYDIISRTQDIRAELCSLFDKKVISSHNTEIITDRIFSEVVLSDYDAIVIPGGLKALKTLFNYWPFLESLIMNFEKLVVAASSLAPAFISNLGLLNGIDATAHPFSNQFSQFDFSDESVISSSNFISSRSAGHSVAFAFEIIKKLESEDIEKLESLFA